MTDTKSAAAPTARRTDGPRRTARPGLVLLVIAGAQLMVVLDATIVNIALPSMGDYFHKTQTSMTWALNAYTLAFGGLLLLGGRSGDLLGRRRMFIVGLSLFSIGSLLGGLAPSYGLLLFGRVVQGIGGAISSPTALSLVTTEFEEGEARTRAFAVYAAVSGAGAALGLLLGGVLTEYFTWRWVLFVNVPIGVVLIAGAYLYLHESERRQAGRFDALGGLLSIAGMVGVVYGFIHAANDGWSNSITVGVLVAAGVLLIAFFLWETRAADPMLPVRVIADRNRGGAYLVMLIVGAAMFGMFYFVTFFIQQVMHFSALRAGFAFLPVAFIIGVTSQIMTKALPRFGPKPLIVLGAGLLTVAMFWYAHVDAGSGYWNLFFPGLVVMAAGMGCIFVPLTTVAVARVRNTDAGVASAMLNVGQQVGGSLGLSILATVAATAGRSAGKSKAADLAQQVKAGHLRPDVFKHLQELTAAQQGHTPSAAALHDSAAVQAVAQIQAHSSGMGFLVAGFLGIAAIVVALILINVRKTDVPTEPSEVTAAA
ncbi:DHA2 family efflux MFS transporter permease subunit [uncultured Jatrophihabitans sp.]|uniref:DHA2 family efflux MFS transporter permease subunit n=1 Tax=uncultured Jatrophihabitans sp. TaxID=1610747 RepID=UPI0035C9EE94